MGQFVLGLFLLALAAILAFYGQQLARDGWTKVYSPPSAVGDSTATDPIKTTGGSASSVNQVGVTAGIINGNVTINKTSTVNQVDEKVIREAYIATERPWVSVDAAISSGLIKKPEGIEFGVNFTVNNHGKSPAINVHVLYDVVPLKLQSGDPFIGVRQKIYDLGIKSKVGGSMGIQLFPSEVKTIRWINTLSTNEIENATKSLKTPSGFLPSFYIVGSVFYQLAFDGEIRHTDFIYYVCAIGDPRYPKGSDVPVFTSTFPMERIFLDPVPYGKGTIS